MTSSPPFSAEPSSRRQRSDGDDRTGADFSVRDDRGMLAVVPSGDWTVLTLGDAPRRLRAALQGKSGGDRRFDAHDLGHIDTAGAYALLRALRDTGGVAEVDLADRGDLERLRELVEQDIDVEPTPKVKIRSFHDMFEQIGHTIVTFGREGYAGQVMLGRTTVALGRSLRTPHRLRPVPLVQTIQQAGLNALPIVVAMTFFIGAILALVGSTMLQTLGVTVYTVELVGIGIMREFGVVIAAILFAGRTAAAFAAQIGSMRMNQEVDAMKVMGIDEYDALVVPRVLAALVALPLMTVVADVGGIVGGMLVSWMSMDITPTFFLQRLVDAVGAKQFWIGMSKAPFFAITVAIVGCRQGLQVGDDVESLGLRVTAAVVQSIFVIIMFDALFAILYKSLDL